MPADRDPLPAPERETPTPACCSVCGSTALPLSFYAAGVKLVSGFVVKQGTMYCATCAPPTPQRSCICSPWLSRRDCYRDRYPHGYDDEVCECGCHAEQEEADDAYPF